MSIKKNQKRGFENTSVALIVNILSPESGPICGCYIQWIRGGYFYKKPPSTPDSPSVERRSTVYQGLGQFQGKEEAGSRQKREKGPRTRSYSADEGSEPPFVKGQPGIAWLITRIYLLVSRILGLKRSSLKYRDRKDKHERASSLEAEYRAISDCLKELATEI
ncbi:hypothetical protein ACH5RR_000077 [Cinchona calisaya]|uniref:Uncharacterized protein n=1 Tax=Cinchona calisaya TaxID=153742 RepID=A0ABD3AZU6_9GENT